MPPRRLEKSPNQNARSTTDDAPHFLDKISSFAPNHPRSPRTIIQYVSNFLLSSLIRIEQVQNPENLRFLGGNGGLVAIAPHTSHLDSGVIQQLLYQYLTNIRLRNHTQLHAQTDIPRYPSFDLGKVAFIAAADTWYPEFQDTIHKRYMVWLQSTLAHLLINTLPIIRNRNSISHLRPENSNQTPSDFFKSTLSTNFDRIAAYINSGNIACIYPEGTRAYPGMSMANRNFSIGTGELIARLNDNVPVIPIHIHGTQSSETWPKEKQLPKVKRTSFSLSVGRPLYFETSRFDPEDSHTTRAEITKAVFAAFLHLANE